MVEKSATTVEIFGREYKIKGVGDERYVQSIAKYVDDKMREVSNESSLPSQDRLAILAALNIADELFQERQQSFDVCSSIEEKTDRMINVLDKNLQSKD